MVLTPLGPRKKYSKTVPRQIEQKRGTHVLHFPRGITGCDIFAVFLVSYSLHVELCSMLLAIKSRCLGYK